MSINSMTTERNLQSPGEREEFFESKYIVSRDRYHRLLASLRQKTKSPEKFSYAHLRTYYFDDRTSTHYFDSRDGQLNKKKYRLREYIDPEEGGAYYSIEIKRKREMATSKVKQLIFQKLPDPLRITTFERLLSQMEKLHGASLLAHREELPRSELFLDTVVCYERFRFDDKWHKARFNLDTNITVHKVLKPNAAWESGVRLDFDIFEIKTNERDSFPYYLKDLELHASAFSKFVWGKERFMS